MTFDEKKSIKILLLLSVLGSFFTLFRLSVYGNKDQVFTDVVCEYTSVDASNKSIEITLIYLLIFGGAAVIFSLFLLRKNKADGKLADISAAGIKPEDKKLPYILPVMICVSSVLLISFGQVKDILLVFLIYIFVVYVISPELLSFGMISYFMSMYALAGIYRLYSFLGGKNDCNTMQLSIASVILSLIPFLFKDKKKALRRFILTEQVFVPTVLYIFLANRYKCEGSDVMIPIRGAALFAVGLIMSIFMIAAILKLRDEWKSESKVGELISYCAPVCIMLINRYTGRGVIMPADIRHPFENIISFYEIFIKHVVPFKEYIPVSGLFSVLQGAVFYFFGDGGKFSYYVVTDNLFYLAVIALIVFLLTKIIDMEYVFMISIFLQILEYNRVSLMIPIMLLLLVPALNKSRGYWLLTWFVTGVVNFLYYPLYGAAVVLGFMPLGIYKFITWIKSGEAKRDIKRPVFVICALLSAAFFIGVFPFIWGSVKHMKAMAGQTVYADGIARFGQVLTDRFFPFIDNSHPVIRLAVNYIVTFTVPALLVWAGLTLAFVLGGLKREGKKISLENVEAFCLSLVIAITPAVAFSYTFVRTEIDNLYVRSAHVLIAASLFLALLALKYPVSRKYKLAMICFALFVPALNGNLGIMKLDSDQKLKAAYDVDDDYICVNTYLGYGFEEEDLYYQIDEKKDAFAFKDPDGFYMGDSRYFGFLYTMGAKGAGPIELKTARGFDACNETIDCARRTKSNISFDVFEIYQHYYLYEYLMRSGEYIWDEENRQFVYNENGVPLNEVLSINKKEDVSRTDTSGGKTFASWGASFDSLKGIFDNKEVSYRSLSDGMYDHLIFDEPLAGSEADFLYLEFEGMDEDVSYAMLGKGHKTEPVEVKGIGKKFVNEIYNDGVSVEVTWVSEDNVPSKMTCNMCKGKLLIPLGSGSGWLMDEHDGIDICVIKGGKVERLPEVKECRFLKIRKAGI